MSSQSINFDPATVSVTWSGGTYTTTLTYGGFGYSVGDILTFQGTIFGGTTPANDLTLSFTISSTGVVSTVTASGTSIGSGSIVLTVDNVRASKMARDSSDYTKMLKQRIIYLEKRAGSPIIPGGPGLVPQRPQKNPAGVNHLPAGNAEILWIPQGNQYRLDYLAGKMKCRACVGGAFNLNGPLSKS